MDAVDPTPYTHYMSSLSEDPKFQIIGSTRTADGVLQLVEHMVGRPLVNDEERREYLAVFMKSDPSTLSPEVLSELTSRGLLGEST